MLPAEAAANPAAAQRGSLWPRRQPVGPLAAGAPCEVAGRRAKASARSAGSKWSAPGRCGAEHPGASLSPKSLISRAPLTPWSTPPSEPRSRALGLMLIAASRGAPCPGTYRRRGPSPNARRAPIPRHPPTSTVLDAVYNRDARYGTLMTARHTTLDGLPSFPVTAMAPSDRWRSHA